MAVKTGVDILTRAVDLTRQGLDSTIDRVRGIGREVKEANKAGGELGAAFSVLRGGAAVAGVAMMADQLARASEGAVELRGDMRRLNEPILDTTRRLLEAVPAFGMIVQAGGRFTDSMFELATGSEMLSREAMAQAREYERINQLLAESSALHLQLWESGDRRRIGLEDEVRLLETILANGIENESTTRAAIDREVTKKEILLRQGEELARFEAQRLEIMQRVLQTAKDLEATQRDYTAETARMREDLERQNQRELELLDRRQQLDRELEGRKAAQEAERDRERTEEQLRREQYRQQEELRREAEQLQRQAEAEDARRIEAVRNAEDRLVGFKEDRGGSGRAQAFLARRGEQGEAMAAMQRRSNEWLRRIEDRLRQLVEDPTEVIG